MDWKTEKRTDGLADGRTDGEREDLTCGAGWFICGDIASILFGEF